MRSRLMWIALLGVSLPAMAEMYRWVDASGQVHFSQTKPTGSTYEVIGHAPPPADAPNQDALNQSLQKSVEEAPKKKEEADKVAQAAAQRQDRCRNAMNQLAYLDAHTPRRLATKDAQGNPVRMSDEDFDKQKAEMQKQIKENCD